jgi:hypothetical protein
MSLEVSITASKDTVTLGETVEVTYQCTGSYDCTLQSDNMPAPIVFGTGEVSGTMKFLPVHTGSFSVTITALGNVDQKLGIDPFSITDTTPATVTVNVI